MMKRLLLISLLFCYVLSYSQNGSVKRVGKTVQIAGDSAIRVVAGGRPYLDMIADISTSLSNTPAWTLENYCSTGIPTVFLRHDQDDQIFIKIQYNHNKALGTNIADVHLHAVPMSNGNGDVRFVVYYKWINYGELLPIDTSFEAGAWSRTFVTFNIVAADQYKENVYTLLSNVTAIANETPSSILHMIITRKSSSALDSYTTNKACGGTNAANFAISFIDSHYQCNKLGSKNIVTD